MFCATIIKIKMLGMNLTNCKDLTCFIGSAPGFYDEGIFTSSRSETEKNV